MVLNSVKERVYPRFHFAPRPHPIKLMLLPSTPSILLRNVPGNTTMEEYRFLQPLNGNLSFRAPHLCGYIQEIPLSRDINGTESSLRSNTLLECDH